MQPVTINRRQAPAFLSSAISRIASTDSCLAESMNAHVLTTRTSASEASAVSSCPARSASPSITSESTRFFGQPREIIPTFIEVALQRETPQRASWIEAVQHPWIRDRLPQVIQLADPRDHALDSHSEAAVRHGSVAAEIEVPLEGVLRQI